jgi:AcrR family transcriptional regulator
MRTRDKNKEQAIVQAVFEMTRTDGIVNLSMGKIAKHAGVSSATAYVYYEDKTDMLSKIYLQVKDIMDNGLAEKITATDDVKEQARITMRHFAHRTLTHPLEANFMMAVQANPDMVSAFAIEQSMKMATPVTQLFLRAVEGNLLKETDMDIVVSFFSAPMNYFLEQKFQRSETVTEEQIEKIIQMSLSALMAD